MAKQIKAALIAAFVVFVVATTGGFGASFAAFGTTGAAALAAVSFATNLLMGVIAKMTLVLNLQQELH